MSHEGFAHGQVHVTHPKSGRNESGLTTSHLVANRNEVGNFPIFRSPLTSTYGRSRMEIFRRTIDWRYRESLITSHFIFSLLARGSKGLTGRSRYPGSCRKTLIIGQYKQRVSENVCTR